MPDGAGRIVLAQWPPDFGLRARARRATLIVAVGSAAAIRFGWLPISVARASDVGMSYGAMAVLGALTIAIPARWRAAWIGWWLMVAVLAVFAGDGFTNAGHLVALMIGMSLSARFRVVAQWTPTRCALLAIGAAFGYLVLANELPSVIATIAGLLGALIGHRATHRWRGRRLPSPHSSAAPVEPPPYAGSPVSAMPPQHVAPAAGELARPGSGFVL